MFKKIRYYISPYFILRHYLARDIKYFVKKYKFEGKVLDFGCGQKPFEQLFRSSEYFGIDFRNYSKSKDIPDKKPDYYFEEDYPNDFALPFETERFDHCVSFQVLEHHKAPEKMISEMARVVKKRGLILLSCPFIYGLHEEPGDFQRFTEYKLSELFKANSCRIVKVKKQGSIFSVFSTLISEYLNTFAAKNKPCYFLAGIMYIPFLFFQYLSMLLDKIFESDKIFINYIILAEKK